jgi:hypothetical protein
MPLVGVEQPKGLADRLGLGGREVQARPDWRGGVDVEVSDGGSVTLRPVVVLPRDDAWAYTAEHLANVAKGLADIREGRVRQLSEDDLAAYDD